MLFGCYLDIAVDLEVQEVGAFEYMVLVTKQAALVEAADSLLSGGVGMTAQLNVQAVAGAAKP